MERVQRLRPTDKVVQFGLMIESMPASETICVFKSLIKQNKIRKNMDQFNGVSSSETFKQILQERVLVFKEQTVTKLG